MKIFVFGLFVALAFANPIPLEEEHGNPVEVIINGHPEGQPLDIGDIVDIKLKEHVDGQLASATNVLYPYSAQGLAEAAANEAESQPAEPQPEIPALPEPEIVVPAPAPVDPNPEPEQPVPEPIVLPEPVLPEVVVPEINPEVPEVNPAPVPVPEAQIPNGEIYNDGIVQVSVNAPQEPGVFSTLQSWFNLALNYFNNGVQTTHQIV